MKVHKFDGKKWSQVAAIDENGVVSGDSPTADHLSVVAQNLEQEPTRPDDWVRYLKLAVYTRYNNDYYLTSGWP